jgi:N-methylhydantoinase A
MSHLFIGIDTGGTFTDLVVFQHSNITIHKILSTPDDPSRAILQALEQLGILQQAGVIVHGSTVATNAVLERKGVKTGLITTAGFRDVLEIGRQARPHLYDLRVQKIPPLVPRDLRVEVVERLNRDGEVLVPLDEATIEKALNTLNAAGVASIAISLLFSFTNPDHERLVAERARARGFAVSASYEVLPEFREYERTSTIVLNAYVGPLMDRYLERLEQLLPPQTVLRIMQSNGGSISSQEARHSAARTLLSGPAAGVVGAAFMAKASGYQQIITLDIGGTSTDVALVNGTIVETTTGQVGGYPTRLPMIDIHTVGAGGGSIAWFDDGGALRVGPHSAGAVPGPAAYALGGTRATVTDANIILLQYPQTDRRDRENLMSPHMDDSKRTATNISRGFVLGGTMLLDVAAARKAMDSIAQRLQTSIEEAAWGIIRVVNANMEAAIRVISVERGVDPRQMTLVAFGGAGPQHACELAAGLHIPRVLIPTVPGVLSALGMLVTDTRKDYVQTVMLPVEDAQAHISHIVSILEERGRTDLLRESFSAEQIYCERFLDMRYLGQSYELTITLEDRVDEAVTRFHMAHEQRFGYSDASRDVQVVSVRLRAYGRTERPSLTHQPEQGRANAIAAGQHRIYFAETSGLAEYTVPLYQREQLLCGMVFAGPALVIQYDTTTIVPPGWSGRVDAVGNLILEKNNGRNI